MKRPSKRKVIDAIRADYPSGKIRYVEAVELDSGVIVLEYEVRTKPVGWQPKGKRKTHYTRRLVIINAEGRFRESLILNGHWE